MHTYAITRLWFTLVLGCRSEYAPPAHFYKGTARMKTRQVIFAAAFLMTASVHAQAWRDCVRNSIYPGGCESIGPGGGMSIGPGGGQSIGPGGGLSIGPGDGMSIGPGGEQSVGPGGGQSIGPGRGRALDNPRGLNPNTMRPYGQ